MKINYQSDFDFIYNPVDCRGEAIGFPPEGVDWRVEFRTHPSGKVLTASCIRGVCVNCFNDGGRIHVVARDHGLAPGRLVSTMTILNPNGIYRPDGIQRIVDRRPTSIELVTGCACTCATTPVADVSLPVIGYSGLKADIGQVASDLQTHIYQYDNLNNRFGSWSGVIEQEVQAIKSRLDAIGQAMWRYHERPALIARLVAIGYDETTAAGRVDALVAVSTVEAEKGVALREQLATLRYTPTEIEECIEDVPALTQADIDYAKEILDAWDPASTSLNKAFQGDSRLVVFPRIDTSNVTDTAYLFDKCGNLGYVPWLDTSKVSSANFMFGWNEPCGKLKRVPSLDWSSLRSVWGPYTGLPELRLVPSPLDLSHTMSIRRLFAGGGTSKPEPFPEILLPSEGNVTITLLCDVTGTQFPITEFPDNVVTLDNLYAYGHVSGDLSGITFKAHGVKSAQNMLGWNFNITHGPKIDMPQLENMIDFLVFMEDIVYVPDYSACSPKLVNGMLKPNNQTGKLRRVEGLNFARVTDGLIFGGDVRFPQYQLSYMRIINLGQSELTTYPDFACALKWGTGSEEARRSLVNSLLTDSYDRTAAGMPPATIKLSTASKAALTAEEIAAITAKGFTIA